MVFDWSLSDSKSPQVSRTLLSILAVLNNAIFWKVSTRPPTSKSSSPFSNPLVTVPNAPITIGIIVTCMFDSFFNSLARSRYYYYYYYYLCVFCTSISIWSFTRVVVVFQVSRTLHSILADINYVKVSLMGLKITLTAFLPLTNEYSSYDAKQCDSEAQVMLEIWKYRIPLHWHCFQVHSGPEW